jgi:ketosteroid isomerase-like protein
MRINKLLLVVLTMVILLAPLSTTAWPKPNRQNTRDATAILAVIGAQRDAWNRGDVGGYMDGYERTPNTVLVSGDSVTRGWQTVHDRYQKNYNTREKMGTLTFSEMEVTPLGKDVAKVIGRWHLQRAGDEPHGRFTLLLRRTKQGWRIFHDHTSSA